MNIVPGVITVKNVIHTSVASVCSDVHIIICLYLLPCMHVLLRMVMSVFVKVQVSTEELSIVKLQEPQVSCKS